MLEPEYKKRSPWRGIITAIVIVLAVVAYFWFSSKETQAPTHNEPVGGVEMDLVDTNSANSGESSRIQRQDYMRPVDDTSMDEATTTVDSVEETTEITSDTVMQEETSAPAEPETTPTVVISKNITIASPSANEVLTSPVTITGEAIAPADNMVTIRVTNTDGTALISETARVQAAVGEKGSYKITIHFQFSTTKEGFIEVGEGVDIARIPVRFE